MARTTDNPHDAILSFKLPGELKEKANEAAACLDVDRSVVLRRALAAFLVENGFMATERATTLVPA